MVEKRDREREKQHEEKMQILEEKVSDLESQVKTLEESCEEAQNENAEYDRRLAAMEGAQEKALSITSSADNLQRRKTGSSSTFPKEVRPTTVPTSVVSSDVGGITDPWLNGKEVMTPC